jgi:hypothetical protein
VQQGSPSLLRRARPRRSRGRASPLFSCLVVGGLLVPAGAGWSAPPTPDPAPPGVQEAEGTTLRPDVRPTPPKSDPATPPPSTAPPVVTQPPEPPAAPRSVEAPVKTRSVERPVETQHAEAPVETQPAEAPLQTRAAETPAASRSFEATVEPPPPPPTPVAPRAPRPRPASAGQKPVRASTPRARPERRRFAALEKQRRWPSRAGASRVPTIDVVALVSPDPESRPYGEAAFSLVVLVLGSATLLTVLARLRATGRRLI